MITKKEIEQAIFTADASDGFRVQRVTLGDEYSLHLGFYVGGRPVDLGGKATRQIWCRDNPSDKDLGDMFRVQLFAEALCRFFNTGGDWKMFEWLIGEMRQMSQAGTPDILGFHLIDSAFNTDGVAEHMFARDDSQHVIRWVEGRFFDVLSLVQVQNEVQERIHEKEQEDADGRVSPITDSGRLLGAGGAGTATQDDG
jgi:hypothetical protein